MGNPCCCCGVSTGARILALVSLVLAIALVGTSAWVLKETYEYRETGTHKAAKDAAQALDKIGSFFGAKGKIDDSVDRSYRILIGCSAATVAVGGLQLLSSIFLCIGAAGKSRAPSGIYGFVNTVGFIIIVGSIACIFYTNIWDIEKVDQIQERDQYWLAAMVGDGLFLLYGICASCCLMRS